MMGVGVVSVVNWINRGELKAGVTPGGHRRIAPADLIEFLRRHNLPVPQELTPSAPRVLIVDDEAGVRAWIREEILERHPDYEVKEAPDGFTAGELVAAWKPDVVILDLRMPGMDGFEVCRRIRAREESRNAVVIAMTAYHSPGAEKNILECGARVCLAKPLDVRSLMAEIEKAVGR